MNEKTVKKIEKKPEQKIEQKIEQIDLLDVLLDQNNREPIVLMDEKGRQLSFEQVAVIPYEIKETKYLYCILKPLDKIDGINDDEAVVFVVDQDKNGASVLRAEADEEVAIAVFDKYYDLIEEAKKATPKKAATKKPEAKTAAPAAKSATKTAGKVAGKKVEVAPKKAK